MHISTISMTQALDVWSDLMAALYGENKYGGDIAEIYLYRLMTFSPTLASSFEQGVIERDMNNGGIRGEWLCEIVDNANTALHDLLVHFAKQHEAAIEVSGRELGEWLKTARFTHRVHVKVTSLRSDRKPTDPRYLATLDKPMAIGNIGLKLGDALAGKGLDPCTRVTFKPGRTEGTIDVFAEEER